MTLAFDEASHTYTANGTVIPSVTQILQPLSAMHYNGISQATLDHAAERGTLVHNAIENWVKFGYDDCPEELHGYLDAYKAWEKDSHHSYIASECKVYNDIPQYAGTIDMVIDTQDGLGIVDFKTTTQLNEKLVPIQLEAYAHAYERQTGEQAKQLTAVQLKADGTYTAKTWGRSSKHYKIFSACRCIYDHMKG